MIDAAFENSKSLTINSLSSLRIFRGTKVLQKLADIYIMKSYSSWHSHPRPVKDVKLSVFLRLCTKMPSGELVQSMQIEQLLSGYPLKKKATIFV